MDKIYIATLTSGIWDFKSVSDSRVKAVSSLITEVFNFNQYYEGLGYVDREHVRENVEVHEFDVDSVFVNNRYRIDGRDLRKEPI